MTTVKQGSLSAMVAELQTPTTAEVAADAKIPMADATPEQVKVAEHALAGLVKVLMESGFSAKTKANKSGGLYWGVYPKGRIDLPDGTSITMSITFNTSGKANNQTGANVGKLVLPS